MDDMTLVAFIVLLIAQLILLVEIWRIARAAHGELRDQTNELRAIRGLLEDQTRYFVED